MEIKVNDYLYKSREDCDEVIYLIMKIDNNNIRGKIVWKNSYCEWNVGQVLNHINNKPCGFFDTVKVLTEAEVLAYTL